VTQGSIAVEKEQAVVIR